MSNITPQSPFDRLRQFDERGEYWSARTLMPELGYPRWNDFKDAIERAKASCENAGNLVSDNFSGLTLKNPGRGRPAADYRLSRYACYLVAMNGDPRKPEIAAAQSYFAISTRKAETQTETRDPYADLNDRLARNLEILTRMEQLSQERTIALQQGQQELAAKVEVIEKTIAPEPGYYTTMGFARSRGLKLDFTQMRSLGVAAAKLCREKGIEKTYVPDSRFGRMRTYPTEVLEEANAPHAATES